MYEEGKDDYRAEKDLEAEMERAMQHRSEDYYSQIVGKSKRRKRIQDRRSRDNDDFMYERPVKKPRIKNIRHYNYDEGYYG